MTEFEVGKRVIHARYGEGKILDIDIDGSILVQFDKENGYFHDGRGKGEPGHCWWVTWDSLTLALPDAPEGDAFLRRLLDMIDGGGDRPDLTLAFVRDEIIRELEAGNDDSEPAGATPEQ